MSTKYVTKDIWKDSFANILRNTNIINDNLFSHHIPLRARKKAGACQLFFASSDIISNLFLEDLERIWELKRWIPDPCNPHLHYLKEETTEEKEP